MPYLGSTPNASFSSRTKQDFTANGSTTAFTLSSAVASANDIEVFVGNVRQEPTDAYTVNGTTLTMSEAPETGLNFYVVFKGLEENSVVPADGTITNAKLGLGQSLEIPSGTTAQRPASPSNGDIRYNSTENEFEVYKSSAWRFLDTSARTTGGNETKEYGLYKYHVFTSTGNLIVNGISNIEVLSIGGGGGGGADNGGGGGAGEVDGFTTVSNASGTYVATVGSGGSGNTGLGRGAQGGTSTFALSGGATYVTSLGGGGGGGGGADNTGGNGGSGGGGGLNGTNGGTASGSNTNAGGGTANSSAPNYTTGGGGGATAAGGAGNGSNTSGSGGAGKTWASLDSNLTASNFTSLTLTVVSGGGGGGGNAVTAGSGSSGGGDGNTSGNGQNAVTYGSGGGGAGNSADGGNGRQGIIIVRVPLSE